MYNKPTISQHSLLATCRLHGKANGLSLHAAFRTSCQRFDAHKHAHAELVWVENTAGASRFLADWIEALQVRC